MPVGGTPRGWTRGRARLRIGMTSHPHIGLVSLYLHCNIPPQVYQSVGNLVENISLCNLCSNHCIRRIINYEAQGKSGKSSPRINMYESFMLLMS